jgi:hypothetical protein
MTAKNEAFGWPSQGREAPDRVALMRSSECRTLQHQVAEPFLPLLIVTRRAETRMRLGERSE